MNDEDDLSTGAAGGDGSAASADRVDMAGGASHDAAEAGFERDAADRAAMRGDRREESRFSRALRDRAILMQQNAELQARLAAVEAQRAKDRADGYGVELTRAEREVSEAVQAGDADAIARANRRVAELAAGRTAASLQAQEAAAVAQQAQARRSQPEAEGPSPTTAAWVDANGWYGRDARMTRQARALHLEAVEDEGLAPDTPAYWRFIEEGLETRFPGKVASLYSGERRPASAPRGAAQAEGEGETAADPAAAARVPARAVSGAAPVSRTPSAAQPAGGQQLRLSADAVSMAKALGLTPQQYASRAAQLARQGRLNVKTITGA